MKRKIIAFGMALLVFAGSSMTVLAGVCPHPDAPEGVHHFDMGKGCCKVVASCGRTEDLGYHQYLYGYAHDGKPIYHNDCHLTRAIQYCMYVCFYCGAEELGGGHEHPQEVRHSVTHRE